MRGNGQHRPVLEGIATFEAFCREVEAPLYSYALRLTRDRDAAQDIAQEALLRVYQKQVEGGLRVESRRGLAFTLVHNLAVDHHRLARRRPPQPPDAAPAAQSLERALLREQIDLALADLPEVQRAALLLRTYGELSYGEIAETLKATSAQVRTWIHRARARLVSLLDRDGQYIGDSAKDRKK